MSRTLQMALDAPEPVAYLVEGWHDGKLIAHIPHLTLEDAKASAAVFSQHYTTTKLVPLYAAPPAAPAPVPDGWVMVPREPTPEMLAVVRNGPMHETWTEGYCAMIAASPAAPAAPVPLTKGQIDFILGDSFLAAKAAGIDLGEHARFIGDHPQLWFYNDSRKHPMCRKPNRAGNVPWNPLADDGDALRLAVKLDIDLIRESLDDVPSTPTHVKAQSWDLEFSASEALGNDHYAATRRAIVRAAAEIGRAMP